MSGQLALDVGEALVFNAVCDRCGCIVDQVPVEDDNWNAAASWVYLAISTHRAVCDGRQLALAGLAAPSVAVRPCHACRRGAHADHHDGVWTRADGSDPVLCDCERCTTASSTQGAIDQWRTRHEL